MSLSPISVYHERPVNHLSFVRVTGQGFRVMVRVGKYTLQMYFGGVRTRD